MPVSPASEPCVGCGGQGWLQHREGGARTMNGALYFIVPGVRRYHQSVNGGVILPWSGPCRTPRPKPASGKSGARNERGSATARAERRAGARRCGWNAANAMLGEGLAGEVHRPERRGA